MESIYASSVTCLQSFLRLVAALQRPKHCQLMPPERLGKEYDRFKIWCGNLGALQTGRSSLDFRLRDSEVVRTNVLKLLASLQQELTMKSAPAYSLRDLYLLNAEVGTEVASETRLPFDEFSGVEDSESSDEDSENSDADSVTELELRMKMITEILGDLYKLSFKIRNSTTRLRPLKPSIYKEIDEDTGIDKFAIYALFDKQHIQESFIQLRKEAPEELGVRPSENIRITERDSYLIDRLAATVTERRKMLRYWQRHAKKLTGGLDEVQELDSSQQIYKGQELGKKDFKVVSQQAQIPLAPTITGKTILSGTEATAFDRKIEDMLDTQSTISYSTTSFDESGHVADIPSPPATAFKQSEFLCPYCGIVYPSRYASDPLWRKHFLQDLQPYVCTYPNCSEGLVLYGSRHAWLEHERLWHRRVWQCFEHNGLVFSSKSDLHHHLELAHSQDVNGTQVQDILDVSESSIDDVRDKCPICLIDKQNFKDLGKHISVHLERFAIFSVFTGFSASDHDNSSEVDNRSEKAQIQWSVDYSLPDTLHPGGDIRTYSDIMDDTTGDITEDNLEEYMSEERWVEVEEMQKNAVYNISRTLGPEDSITLEEMVKLAKIYLNLGKYDRAEDLFLQALSRYEKISEAASKKWDCMQNLVTLYVRQERWDEAEQTQLNMVELLPDAVGEDYNPILLNADSVLSLYARGDKFHEVVFMQKQVAEGRKRVFGQMHPDTLKSMSILAKFLRLQDRRTESRALLEDCLRLQADSTSNSGSDIDLISRILRRWKESEDRTPFDVS